MALDKKILSIDNNDDDKNYLAFSEYLEEDTQRKKQKAISEIEKMGEDLLIEIEKKKVRKEIIKEKYIRYIMKHHDGSVFSEKALKSYSYEDVLQIYNEIKELKRSKINKFFRFIFNL